MTGIPPTFTARDIGLIKIALPTVTDPAKLAQLPAILRYWCENELSEHLSVEGRATATERNKRFARLSTAADKLLAELKALPDADRDIVALNMTMKASNAPFSPSARRSFRAFPKRLSAYAKVLQQLSASAKAEIQRFGRGQPKNTTAYLVMLDIADIFEDMTGCPATRQTNRRTGDPEGPFWDFASAIWPVVFGAGDDGLQAAIRNWVTYKTYNDRSSLIANFRLS